MEQCGDRYVELAKVRPSLDIASSAGAFARGQEPLRSRFCSTWGSYSSRSRRAQRAQLAHDDVLCRTTVQVRLASHFAGKKGLAFCARLRQEAVQVYLLQHFDVVHDSAQPHRRPHAGIPTVAFTGSNFVGGTSTSKPTPGLFLALVGPTTFARLIAASKRETAVGNSSTGRSGREVVRIAGRRASSVGPPLRGGGSARRERGATLATKLGCWKRLLRSCRRRPLQQRPVEQGFAPWAAHNDTHTHTHAHTCS